MNGEHVCGVCNPQDYILYIDVDSNIEETLLHEIIHAEVAEGGYRQRDSWCFDLEEMFAELVAQSISHSFSLKRRKDS